MQQLKSVLQRYFNFLLKMYTEMMQKIMHTVCYSRWKKIKYVGLILELYKL